MTKNLFAFAALSMISISAFATPKAMDPARVPQYQRAVKEALAVSNLLCKQQDGQTFDAKTISVVGSSEVQTGWVDLSGAQPSISLIYASSSGTRNVLTMKTSTDNKRILSVFQESFAQKDANLGTILDPQFGKIEVKVSSFLCLPKVTP